MSEKKRPHDEIRSMNIIDMLLIDHKYLKECIEILTDDEADKSLKLSTSRGFLESVQKHSEAEKKVVYAPLKSDEEFHFNILEAEVEHGIVDEKVKQLKTRVSHTKFMKDEMEAELKVLAELLKHHIKEEESELLPKMNQEIDEETLKEMGDAFMKIRKLSVQDLRDYPQLHDELMNWKDNVQKVSSKFLSKMDKFISTLEH